MMRAGKVRTVATFEFLSTVKRVAYLVTTFGMPVFLLLYGGIVSTIGLLAQQKESAVKIYAVVDQSGVLVLDDDVRGGSGEMPEEIRVALEKLGKHEPLPRSVAWWRNFVFRPYGSPEVARRALLEKEVDGVYVVPDTYVESGEVRFYARKELDLGGDDSRRALGNLLQERMLSGRVAAEVAQRVRDPIARSEEWTVDENGALSPRNVFAVLATLFVPLAFTMLFFISMMMTAGYLLQGVAVEKENKLVEVLLSSARPEEIMTGKLLGLGAAGLLQVFVWFGMIVASALLVAGTMQVSGVTMPWFGIATSVVFFLAGYLFIGSLMLGTGSLGNNMRESQQLSMVWTLLTIVPMFFLQLLIFEPSGTVGRVLIWIPFTAPVTMVLRTTLDPGGTAWWEVVGALAVMLVSIWFALRLGARLFRVGLLLSGARPKLREILRQARLAG